MNKFFLINPIARQRAIEAIRSAPEGYEVTVKEQTRNLDQNALLWALLDDLSKQVDWYGQRLTTEEWKHVMSAAIKQQKVVPGIDGGFVVLGQSTSKMSKRQFSELIELIKAFGAQRGVKFSDGGRDEIMQRANT